MKEHKYRAWDKKTKKIREVVSIGFHNKHSSFDYDNSNLAKVACMIGFDIIEDKHYHIQRDIKYIELLQYTGLKDKNGKEIYEGDIVKVERRIQSFIVQWSDYDASFYGESEGAAPVGFYKYDDNELEIIGNIYEDKDLLK